MVRSQVAISGALLFVLFATLGTTKDTFASTGSEGADALRSQRGAAATRAGSGAATPATTASAAELASARQLFVTALSAEDQGRWSEALKTYERVSKVAVSPSLWYHIGACHEALSHPIEAVNAFELAVSGATARREVELARESRSRLERLRAQTAQLVLGVPSDAVDVHIELDGVPLNPALAGAPVLVVPGDRRVVVRAGNYVETFTTTVHAKAGGLVEVRAEMGGRKASVASGARAVRALAPTPVPASSAPSLTPAFLAGGAAFVLATGAVVTGAVAYGVRDEYLRKNLSPAPGSRALAERQSLHAEGRAFAITSTALTGGALLAGGLATYLFWPSAGPDRRPARSLSLSASPWVGPDGAGLLVGGAL